LNPTFEKLELRYMSFNSISFRISFNTCVISQFSLLIIEFIRGIKEESSFFRYVQWSINEAYIWLTLAKRSHLELTLVKLSLFANTSMTAIKRYCVHPYCLCSCIIISRVSLLDKIKIPPFLYQQTGNLQFQRKERAIEVSNDRHSRESHCWSE